MAAAVRQDLAQLMNSSGSHKDLAGKVPETRSERRLLPRPSQPSLLRVLIGGKKVDGFRVKGSEISKYRLYFSLTTSCVTSEQGVSPVYSRFLSSAKKLESIKVVNENVSLVISRQLLTDFCTHLPNLPDSTAKEIYHFTLEKIQPRVISFEEQVASIRQHLASIYEKEEDWRNAAQVLVGIPLETGQKQYNVDYKLETYLKIARLYLEDDDPVQAEAYINRASLLQNESTNEQLQIHYKVCYARVLDYRRKFIEAAQRYNELSYKTIVHESERLEALKHALHCTILASA
ncbi:PREDICTED: COP9 signalosome complex subunit 4, partial [Galeopterus variegatus]|uniref:COP9 signalosome complex subunit 4 n=1 Tax=Galeopterus variegatus TaxID=482537 RepID=A0ABM0RGC3_GALVR